MEPIDTYSEEYRHQCEVRYVLECRTKDRTKAMEYLLAVENKRGKESSDKLTANSREQWDKGNRGANGDWR